MSFMAIRQSLSFLDVAESVLSRFCHIGLYALQHETAFGSGQQLAGGKANT
jgi:hypothetical protein